MNFLENIARSDFKNLLVQKEKSKVYFVINSGNKTTTVFLFQEKKSQPFGILRISTGMNLVEREFNILKFIVHEDNKQLVQTVPFPYNLHSFGRCRVASLSYLEGVPMIPRRRSFRDHIYRVRKWLVELMNTTVPDFLIEDTWYYNLSRRCDIVLKQVVYPGSSLISVLEKVKSIEKTLSVQGCNLVINHNDLYWGNIFLRKDQIGVVDWESVTSRWPMIEWFFFVFTYIMKMFSCDKKAPGVKFARLKDIFYTRNYISELVLRETSNLLKELYIDEDLMYKFYILGIFDYIYRRYWYDRSMVKMATYLFEEKDNIFYEASKGNI